MGATTALVGGMGVRACEAAKGGGLGFTKAIAAEASGEGIRGNTMHPGMFASNMNVQASTENADEYDAIVSMIPMGYMGAPKTIGDAALFLASDLSAYITGTQLVVDGGVINQ